jgi:hypothetical protein
MAGKDDFSSVEWTILTELPVRVVASAITTDPATGLGSIIEEVTGLTQLSQGATQRPESELVQAVFAQYKENGAGEAATLELSQQAVENLIPETLLRARDAAHILAAGASEVEAIAYKSWLLETAEAVCAAAKTGGGLLGIGGKRVSDVEEEFLNNLEASFLSSPDQSPDPA